MQKITKRKDGRYEAKINLGYDLNGKYKRITIYGKTKAEVRQKIIERERVPASRKKITFIEYAEQFLDMKRAFLQPRTVEMYEQKIYNNLKPLHFIDIKDIDKNDLQQIINKNIEHPRTCHIIKNILSAIFESATEDELIPRNVAKYVRLPKYQAQKKRALTASENWLTDNVTLTDREKAYILIIKWCGLRKEEALALTLKDIDPEGKTISVNKAVTWQGNKPSIKEPKTRSGYRVVPMPDALANYLAFYCSNLSGDNLFTNIRGGGIMSQQSYRRMWESIIGKINALADEKGLERPEGLTAHIFRHNYASLLFSLGIQPKEAQILLGHSNYAVTMDIYTHIEVDNEKVSGLLSSICRQNENAIQNNALN